jgi:hypothetical protein
MENKTDEPVITKFEEIDLKPKPNCKYCYGRGVTVGYHPQVVGQRMLRPCACMYVMLPEKILDYRLTIEKVTVKAEVK